VRHRRERAGPTLYPAVYRLPLTLAQLIKGKRVAIVDDVINADSHEVEEIRIHLPCSAEAQRAGFALG
jgi:hypothetical protein